MSCQIHREYDLRLANSLRLPSVAERFVQVKSVQGLQEALGFAKARRLPVTLLGEGSNLVLGQKIPGLVVRLATAGRARDGERLQAAAGENWHRLVLWSLAEGLYGLENLALIPGTLGAAPIQNIGAYGVEIADFLLAVDAVHKDTLETVRLCREDCGFGYRTSLFKASPQNPWVITSVSLQLSARPKPQVGYRGLADKLAELGLDQEPAAIAQAVMAMRRAKLPDPAEEPNAGSFFKNPSLSAQEAAALRERFPDMPFYEAGGKTRTSAAWLIEQAGLKGARRGDLAVSGRHALVFVNLGRASAADASALAAHVQRRVQARYGLWLEQGPLFVPA